MLLANLFNAGITGIMTVITYIALFIVTGIYSILNSIYKIFMALASAKLLSNDMFTGIATRFYAIVGVTMLFVLAYVIIQGIINPDNFAKSGGDGAQILKRLAIAVLGMALVPGVFRIAYAGQDLVMSQDLIGKIFLGYDKESNLITHGDIAIDGEVLEFNEDGELNQNDAIKREAGSITALTIWQSFFYPTNTEDIQAEADRIKSKSDIVSFIGGTAALALTSVACVAAIMAAWATKIFVVPVLAAVTLCSSAVQSAKAMNLIGKGMSLSQTYGVAATTGNFTVFCAFAENVANKEITFNWLAALIVGLVAAYLFLSFAIDMAVRAVKLIYMQIIAPVPLMLQIIPKFKENFSKWLQTTLSLFAEVFIRLTFVYVIVFLIAHIPSIITQDWLDGSNLALHEGLLARTLLIIGLLAFAKTAPQFVSETLGLKSGSLSLGITKKLAENGALTSAATLGSIGGNLLTGSIRGFKKRREAPKPSGILGSIVKGSIPQALGQTIRNVIPNYLDAKTVKSFSEVRARVLDNTEKGVQRENERDTRTEKIKEELRAHGYDPDAEHKSRITWATAHGARRVESFKEYAERVGGLPKDDEKFKTQLEISRKMEDQESKLQEIATKYNDEYKLELQQYNHAQSGDGRKEFMRKYAADHGVDINKEGEFEAYYNAHSEDMERAYYNHVESHRKRTDDAKKNAVSQEFEKARITGEDNDTTRAAKEFLATNHDLLVTNKHMHITEGGKTLDQLMKELYGDEYETAKLDYSRTLADYGKQEREVGVKTVDGKKGTIRFRKTVKDGQEVIIQEYIDDVGDVHRIKPASDSLGLVDRSGGDWELKFEDNGSVKLEKDMKKAFSPSKVLGDSSVSSLAADGTIAANSGTFTNIAQGVGGTLTYKKGTPDQETLTVASDDISGVSFTTHIKGILSDDLSVSTITAPTSGLVLAGDRPLEMTGKINNRNIQLNLENNGTGVVARMIGVDGSQIDIDTAGRANSQIGLVNLFSTQVDTGKEGVQSFTVGDREVQFAVRGGSITGSKVNQIKTSKSFDGISNDAVISVARTVATMANGDSFAINSSDGLYSYQISKSEATGNVSYSKVNKNTGIATQLTEAQIQEAFNSRAEVNMEEINNLRLANQAFKIQTISASTGKTSEVTIQRNGTDVNYTSRTEPSNKNISVFDIADQVGNGTNVKFDDPATGVSCTIDKSSTGTVTYTYGTENVTKDDFEKKFDVKINGNDVVDKVQNGRTVHVGTTTIRRDETSMFKGLHNGEAISTNDIIDMLADNTPGSAAMGGTISFGGPNQEKIRVNIDADTRAISYTYTHKNTSQEGAPDVAQEYADLTSLRSDHGNLFGTDATIKDITTKGVTTAAAENASSLTKKGGKDSSVTITSSDAYIKNINKKIAKVKDNKK